MKQYMQRLSPLCFLSLLIVLLAGCQDITCILSSCPNPQQNGTTGGTPHLQATIVAIQATQTALAVGLTRQSTTNAGPTTGGRCPSEATVANWMNISSSGDVTNIHESCGFVVVAQDSATCPDQDGAVIEYSTSSGILYLTGCKNQKLVPFTQATIRFGSFYAPYDWPNPSRWNSNPCVAAKEVRAGSGGMLTVLLNPPGSITSCPDEGITVQRG